MSYTNNSIKSGLPLVTPFGGSADVDNVRRTFGIGDKVAQLAPETSIFFSYLSKLGKKATDETIWKPLEYRNQWQRRNFFVSNVAAGTDGDGGTTLPYEVEHWKIWVDYNYQGKVDTTKEYSIYIDGAENELPYPSNDLPMGVTNSIQALLTHSDDINDRGFPETLYKCHWQ